MKRIVGTYLKDVGSTRGPTVSVSGGAGSLELDWEPPYLRGPPHLTSAAVDAADDPQACLHGKMGSVANRQPVEALSTPLREVVIWNGEAGKMRLLCVIPAMGPGGAERVMARLIGSLAEEHTIMLLTYEAPTTPSFYPLPPHVEQVRLDLLGGCGFDRLSRLARRAVAIREVARTWRPDVILSFMDTMNTTAVLSCLGTGVPVVVSERVDPSRHPLPWPKRALRLAAYGMAHAVVVQTERISRAFPSWLRRRMIIIPNGAPLPPSQARPGVPGQDGRFRVIGIGRLEHQKGFDLLIEAFAAIARRHPDWDLVIFGEGSERASLTALSERMGVATRVRLAGLTTSPETEMTASHVIAFPSRYEGFPNALAEGVAAGLPAVAQIGVSGVEELVVEGRTGFLVGDGAPGLADALNRLMTNPALREEMGREARRHAAYWAPDDIYARWAAVLTVAAGKGR